MLYEDGIDALLGCEYPQGVRAEDSRAVVCHYLPQTVFESLPLGSCLAESPSYWHDKGDISPTAGLGCINRPFGAGGNDRKVDIGRQVLDALEHRLAEDGALRGVDRVDRPLRAQQGLEDYPADVCDFSRGAYDRHGAGPEETLEISRLSHGLSHAGSRRFFHHLRPWFIPVGRIALRAYFRLFRLARYPGMLAAQAFERKQFKSIIHKPNISL